MSKSSRKRQRDRRREEKRAKKLANYLRFGPKEGGGVKAKKLKSLKSRNRPPVQNDKPAAKSRHRQRRNGANFRVGGR